MATGFRSYISKTRCLLYIIILSCVLIILQSARCLYTTGCSWMLRPVPRSSIYGDLTTQSCKPLYPRVVFYNRIFKAASSTMSSFLKHSSAALDNLYTRDLTEEWENENISHPVLTRIQNSIAMSEKQNKNLMAIAHLYFRENISATYINLLREPIARFMSHYYYCRSPGRWPIKLARLKALGHYNVTVEECLEKQYEGCAWNHMTRFFCGPQAFCKTGSAEALARAKHNMLHYYASVGVVEYIDEFVQVLHKRLPGFVMEPPARGMKRMFVTTGVEKKPMNESTIERIKNANKADIELYQFARDIFLKQAENCGVEVDT